MTISNFAQALATFALNITPGKGIKEIFKRIKRVNYDVWFILS